MRNTAPSMGNVEGETKSPTIAFRLKRAGRWTFAAFATAFSIVSLGVVFHFYPMLKVLYYELELAQSEGTAQPILGLHRERLAIAYLSVEIDPARIVSHLGTPMTVYRSTKAGSGVRDCSRMQSSEFLEYLNGVLADRTTRSVTLEWDLFDEGYGNFTYEIPSTHHQPHE